MSKKITEARLEEMFDEMLDETNKEITIAGRTFIPSRALKMLDEVAYRSYKADYADALSRDGYEVEGY